MTSYPANYANIGPALATLFSDKIANQIMRATVLLKLLPVTKVDSRKIGSGQIGQFTKLLHISYQKQVIREVLK